MGAILLFELSYGFTDINVNRGYAMLDMGNDR